MKLQDNSSQTSNVPSHVTKTPTKTPNTPTKNTDLRCFVARQFLPRIYALFWWTIFKGLKMRWCTKKDKYKVCKFTIFWAMKTCQRQKLIAQKAVTLPSFCSGWWIEKFWFADLQRIKTLMAHHYSVITVWHRYTIYKAGTGCYPSFGLELGIPLL